jgi:mannose-1-phosphate guanylyltransferase
MNQRYRLKRIAVIMAGGAGERFWPLSRIRYPKQLLKIAGNKSMLSRSIERIQPLVSAEDIYVITNAELKPAIEGECCLPPENIVAEPMGKNTAACLALASSVILKNHPDEDDTIMMVMTADHHIRDTDAFRRDCADAIAFAEKNDALITFGIPPSRPETGYGYIELNEADAADGGVCKVASFREKPNLETAREFEKSGRFLWNSGMFVWRTSSLVAAFQKHLPDVFERIEPMREAYLPDPKGESLASLFDDIPRISIDCGILERAANVFVVHAHFDWDDIGTWNSLGRLLGTDASGNVIFGNSTALQCENTTIYSDASPGQHPPLVVGFGLRDLIIVRTRDALLVLPADSAQQVKEVVAHLREEGMTEYL